MGGIYIKYAARLNTPRDQNQTNRIKSIEIKIENHWDMSELVDAAEKEEWDKLMVRRLLQVVLYLQRI